MQKCMRCMNDFDQQEYCPYCGRRIDLPPADIGQLPQETILKGRFIIGEVKARDRIGFTYIAWDALLERSVLIREWFPYKLAERLEGQTDVKIDTGNNKKLCASLNSQFVSYAKGLCRLQTIPFLVTVYTGFEENGTAYYVMENIEGITLRQMLEMQNPLDEHTAMAISQRIRDAVKVLHDNKIIHGNLSPDNIVFGKKNEIRFLNPAWYCLDMEKIKYTVFLGRYASPSYLQKSFQPDREMDFYSIAAIEYRMLTGEEPPGPRILGKKIIPVSDFGIKVTAENEKRILKEMGAKPKGLFSILFGR